MGFNGWVWGTKKNSESPRCHGKIDGFRGRCSLKPIHSWKRFKESQSKTHRIICFDNVSGLATGGRNVFYSEAEFHHDPIFCQDVSLLTGHISSHFVRRYLINPSLPTSDYTPICKRPSSTHLAEDFMLDFFLLPQREDISESTSTAKLRSWAWFLLRSRQQCRTWPKGKGVLNWCGARDLKDHISCAHCLSSLNGDTTCPSLRKPI